MNNEIFVVDGTLRYTIDMLPFLANEWQHSIADAKTRIAIGRTMLQKSKVHPKRDKIVARVCEDIEKQKSAMLSLQTVCDTIAKQLDASENFDETTIDAKERIDTLRESLEHNLKEIAILERTIQEAKER